jgi:hypothetical protein
MVAIGRLLIGDMHVYSTMVNIVCFADRSGEGRVFARIVQPAGDSFACGLHDDIV